MLPLAAKIPFNELNKRENALRHPDGLPYVSAAPDTATGTYWSLDRDNSAVSAPSPVSQIGPEIFATKDAVVSFAVSSSVQSAAAKDWSSAQGLGLYVLSTLFLSVQATTAKVLGRRGISTAVMVFFRSLAIMLGGVLPLVYQKPPKPFGTNRGMLVVRGLCSFTSIFLLYTSIQLMPLSDSVVLQFLSPIMVAFAAPLLLKEAPGRLIWVCVPMCLLGVLLTAQPSAIFGSSASSLAISPIAVGVGVTQAAFAASHKICIRYLKGEDTNTQLMYLGAVSMVGSLVMALILEESTMPSSLVEWMLLLLTACAAYGSQMSQTIALKMVQASLATAMSYLSVVWGILSGYLVFNEVPNALSFGGASLVCSCTVVLGLAEQMPASSLRADGHRQPQTWQNMCLLVDCCLDRLYVFGSKIRGVWSRNIGKQDHYEHVAQDELVNDI